MSRRGENIRKRKDGRWEARYISGYGEDGKARYQSIYGKTYEEVRDLKYACVAQLAAQRVVQSVQMDAGIYQITFGQLLADWLQSVKPDVKESTYSKYVFLVEKHILPELGNELLINIDSEVVEQFVSKKLTEGKIRIEGGLSPKSVSSLLSVIKLSLNFGMRRGYECSDYLMIKGPRQKKTDIMILSTTEQKKLEQHLFSQLNGIRLGILLSLYAGLRIGEVCALRWGDFDFENNTVAVQRTITRIQNVSKDSDLEESASEGFHSKASKTKIVIGRPKTECSNRVIPLPAFLTHDICVMSGSPSFYLLTNSQSYMEPRTYYRKYKREMELCGLGQFNYHALRHTFATRCIENHFDLKSLSEILGHANVTTTMQKYVHPSMNLKREHMDRLGDIAIRGQNPQRES